MASWPRRTPLLGALIGVLMAAAFARGLSAQLYGIAPHDPLTFSVVPLILLAVAILAA